MTLNRKQELLALLKQSKEAINGRVWRNVLVLLVKSLSKILHFCEQMVLKLSQLTGVIFIKTVTIIPMRIDSLK